MLTICASADPMGAATCGGTWDQGYVVFIDNNADLVQALNNSQIDGLVIDLGSAFFTVAVQLDNGTIVGQFPTSAQQDQIGAVLELGSPLTACINEAIAAISAASFTRFSRSAPTNPGVPAAKILKSTSSLRGTFLV